MRTHQISASKPAWFAPSCSCCKTYHDPNQNINLGTMEMDGVTYTLYDCRICKSSYALKGEDTND